MSERPEHAPLPLSADFQHICYSNTHEAGGGETELTYSQPGIIKAAVSILRQVDFAGVNKRPLC